MATTPDYAWHVHHEKLYERLTEPIDNRIKYIKSDKPSSEQATRLKLIRPVKDNAALEAIDRELADAWKTYDAALNETKKAHRKAPTGQDYEAASNGGTSAFQSVAKAASRLEVLHRQECEADCPWNGSTIFPAGKR